MLYKFSLLMLWSMVSKNFNKSMKMPKVLKDSCILLISSIRALLLLLLLSLFLTLVKLNLVHFKSNQFSMSAVKKTQPR